MNMEKLNKILKEDIKKRHHYLPVTYIKQWQGDDKKIMIKLKDNSKEYKASPENAFFERNSNTLSYITKSQMEILKETYINFFKNDIHRETIKFINGLYETSNLIDSALNGELYDLLKCYLNDNDKEELEKINKVFLNNLVEDQFSLVEAAYGNFINKFNCHSEYQKILEDLLQFLGLQLARDRKFDSIISKKLKHHVLQDAEIKNIIILSRFIESEIFIQKLKEKYIILQIIHNITEINFITSDSPVVSCNGEFIKYDFLPDYIFPITPKFLLALQLKDRNSNDNNDAYYLKGSLQDLDFINDINSVLQNNSNEKIIIL